MIKSEAADTVALFEREGDLLVMRASAGLVETEGFTIPVGGHLAGRVAAEGRPIFILSATRWVEVASRPWSCSRWSVVEAQL